MDHSRVGFLLNALCEMLAVRDSTALGPQSTQAVEPIRLERRPPTQAFRSRLPAWRCPGRVHGMPGAACFHVCPFPPSEPAGRCGSLSR